MRRTAPGLAAAAPLVALGLVTLNGCSKDAGAPIAATLPATKVTPAPAAPKTALAGLAVLPRGYVADRRNPAAAFDLPTYLGNWSAVPAVDRALLLNAGFKGGYQDTRLSEKGRKRFTVQLFQVATPAKARRLQEGFQNPYPKPFTLTGVPGARTDARVEYDGASGRYVASAESTFSVGPLLAELRVRQTGADTALRPDIQLLTAISRQQYLRLLTITKHQANPN